MMRVLAVRICCGRRDRGYCNGARSSRACGDRAFRLFKRRQSVATRRLHRFPQTDFCSNGMIDVGEMRPSRVLGNWFGLHRRVGVQQAGHVVTRCMLPPLSDWCQDFLSKDFRSASKGDCRPSLRKHPFPWPARIFQLLHVRVKRLPFTAKTSLSGVVSRHVSND